MPLEELFFCPVRCPLRQTTNSVTFSALNYDMQFMMHPIVVRKSVLHLCHPPCFCRTWRIAAVLRGAQAAGVALCYGNNNGGACAAGSVHPLAPSVAQSSPWLFSCPARLCNQPSLLSPSIHPLLSCVYPTQASLSAYVSLIFFSSILPTF